MLENIEGAINNGHSRETDNIIKGTQDTRWKQTKQKHNRIPVINCPIFTGVSTRRQIESKLVKKKIYNL
jgi:hypothetical protein